MSCAAVSKNSPKPVLLLVDDNPDHLAIFGALLEQADHTVVKAESAEAALEILDSDDVDVVVCDLNMPRVSGPEFISAVRSGGRLSDVPVVAFSANSELAGLAFDAGANAFCSKTRSKALIREVENIRNFGTPKHVTSFCETRRQ